MNQSVNETASFFKRLAAILYDGFLLLAIILVATSVVTVGIDSLFGSGTLTRGLEIFFWKVLFQLYLLSVTLLFYVWFWSRSGQTLGMKVWKIRVVCNNGEPVSASTALLRIFWAVTTCLPFGLGLFWALFDRDRETLYDKLSGSRLINTTVNESGG